MVVLPTSFKPLMTNARFFIFKRVFPFQYFVHYLSFKHIESSPNTFYTEFKPFSINFTRNSSLFLTNFTHFCIYITANLYFRITSFYIEEKIWIYKWWVERIALPPPYHSQRQGIHEHQNHFEGGHHLGLSTQGTAGRSV